jgi:trans-aconitate methyltransferase
VSKQAQLPDFDTFAADYTRTLEAGLALAGESQDFFARGRIDLLAKCLDDLGERPRRVMDFGCGQGASVPLLITALNADSALGVDVSRSLLDDARRNVQGANIAFATTDEYVPAGDFDCVYCNGVFHHLPVPDQKTAVDYVSRCLRPGGVFGLWENNPCNPGTHLVMRRIEFDRDAVMLSPAEAMKMLESAGFEIVRTRSAFFFPRFLSLLRPLERLLSRTRLGAQYLVVARKGNA